MAFGFEPAMADTFWLRWIQDADTCYSYFATVAIDQTTFDKKDAFFNPRHRNCDGSWGFKMLDAVTKLDPRFRMPYVAGAMALSVLVEDYEGATLLYNRGLQNYPNDWQLHYRASYHFLFDRQDLPRAAELLTRATTLGGPNWLASLAARLYSRSGQLQLGLLTLTQYRQTLDEGTPAAKDVDKRLAELKAQLRAEQTK